MNREGFSLYSNRQDYWTDFAADAARAGSPLYHRLALGVNGDAGLKNLAARAQPGQPHANLLFGAVHYLLLRGASHPLRGFYPSVSGHKGEADPFPVFQDFVAHHEDVVAALIKSRVTNTNETQRSCVLRAGFAELAKHEPGPLHVIEIGPSAGLNMIWDRFGMHYKKDGKEFAVFQPASPAQLDCEIRGEKMPPLSPVPTIASRLGLERSAVDLAKDEDRDWLRALIWPDQPHRMIRLERAIALFREGPPEIWSGDALDLLPDALARVPKEAAVCIYHSIAVYQFSAAMKEALEALLVTAGLRRPLWHLAFEYDGEDYALRLTRHQDGSREARKLAIAQSHGGWIEWLA